MIDRALAERLEIKYPIGLYLALLETETVDPISERTIRQMTDARARSYALDRFRMECVEPGGEGDVRRQELSRRCKGLLDAIP